MPRLFAAVLTLLFCVSAPLFAADAAPADASKKVLLVVAHRDFFFQEYNDPRKALEAAGYKSVVASTRDRCVPHPNTGQGPNSDGSIKSDVLLKDVKSDDYAAIVFVGGWGASMYQPAFNVKYDNGEYNSPADVKSRVNDLVTQFAKSDKYVGGICHGVTVLAYCKVDGSPLIKGKKISGPAIGGPAFTGSDGKHVNDLALKSQWHIEQNGGTFVPINSIGNSSSPDDDVTVDGKIITAQDNNSAKKFGEVLAQQLSKK